MYKPVLISVLVCIHIYVCVCIPINNKLIRTNTHMYDSSYICVLLRNNQRDCERKRICVACVFRIIQTYVYELVVICVLVCVHVYVGMCVQDHTYAYEHILISVLVCIQICAYSFACMRVYVCVRTQVNQCASELALIFIGAYLRARIYIRTSTYTCMFIYIDIWSAVLF